MKKLLFLFFILNTYNSYSCSCAYKKVTQKEYDNYSLVFKGEIIEVEDCNNRGYQKFSFKVEDIYKGQTTKTVSGFNNCGGTCNFLYEVGQKWLVYSNPEYGQINDQWACGKSIVVYNDKPEWHSLNDYEIYKEEINFEIDFLQKRVTNKTKIVGFQLIKIVPFLKNTLLLCILLLCVFLSYKFGLKLFFYSIGLGIIYGVFYYLLLSEILFPKYIEYKTTSIVLVIVLLLSSIVYTTLVKQKLTFNKLFVFNYLIYASLFITTVYLIIINEHQKIELNINFLKIFFIFLVFGLFFSLLSTLLFIIGKKIRLKKINY